MTTQQQPSRGAADRASAVVEPRFVWHDLVTSDLARARAFYTALFGWDVRDQEMGPEIGSYPMIQLGELGIGGMVQKRGEDPTGSQWMPHIAVADVDASVARVPGLGGKVEMAPIDIPGVGRFAVVSDPSGAMFHLLSLLEPSPLPDAGAEGAVAWNELLTTDPAGARAFYGALLGWGTFEQDMGDLGTYTMFSVAENDFVAGAIQMPDDAEATPMWVPYVATSDVDASARRVKELGGQIFVPPTDIPDIGRFSVCGDPTGATFALYRRA